MEHVTIPARFNGPPGSGNGGFVCGLVADTIGPSASVRLSAPPPLETPLALEAGVLRHGDVTIAEGHAAEPAVQAPEPPSPAAAAEASTRYVGHDVERHPYPHCFVCGPLHETGLHVFPRPADDDLLACVWRPGQDLATDGVVDARFVWAALDCPSGFACMPPKRRSVLATMTATLNAPVLPGHDYVITAWKLGSEGRKHRGAASLTDPVGQQVAVAEALWITLR